MKKGFERPKLKKHEKYSKEYKEQLRDLAKEILKEHLYENVEASLDNDEVDDVREYLFAVMDQMVSIQRLSSDDKDAQARYRLLGFTPEEASRMRQSEVGPEDYRISER